MSKNNDTFLTNNVELCISIIPNITNNVKNLEKCVILLNVMVMVLLTC